MFLYKERKRTQRTLHSFLKNVKERKECPVSFIKNAKERKNVCPTMVSLNIKLNCVAWVAQSVERKASNEMD